MKQKFKKGDIVEVIENSLNGHDIGVVGEVVDVEVDANEIYYDIKDNNSSQFCLVFWHKETDLKLKN